jgi:hypothetical protein
MIAALRCPSIYNHKKTPFRGQLFLKNFFCEGFSIPIGPVSDHPEPGFYTARGGSDLAIRPDFDGVPTETVPDRPAATAKKSGPEPWRASPKNELPGVGGRPIRHPGQTPHTLGGVCFCKLGRLRALGSKLLPSGGVLLPSGGGMLL